MIVTVTLNTSVDKTVEVPGLRVGATLVGRVVQRRAAGKGINVARDLAALGVASSATGLVGSSERALFAAELKRLGVGDRLVPVADRTRENTTYLDPDAATVTHVRERGFTVQPDELARLRSALAELVAAGDWLILAGSLPPGVPVDTVADLVQLGRARGALVAVDSSGPALRCALSARPHLIKPNREELAELTGQPVPDLEAAATLARSLLAEVEIALVSLAADGALVVDAGGTWHGRLPVDRVGNTVGCGDALLAGFVAVRRDGGDLAESLRRAVAVGSARASGPPVGDLERARVDALLPRVELRQLPATR